MTLQPQWPLAVLQAVQGLHPIPNSPDTCCTQHRGLASENTCGEHLPVCYWYLRRFSRISRYAFIQLKRNHGLLSLHDAELRMYHDLVQHIWLSIDVLESQESQWELKEANKGKIIWRICSKRSFYNNNTEALARIILFGINKLDLTETYTITITKTNATHEYRFVYPHPTWWSKFKSTFSWYLLFPHFD